MSSRSSLVAPLALVVLVAAAAAVALLGAKALPAGAARSPAPAREARPASHVHVPTAGGAYGYGRQWSPTASPKTAASLTPTRYSEPRVIASHNGVLRVTFKPHAGSAIVNGERVSGMETFTGTYPGPTLKLRPGDTLRMKFVNRLNEDTNLHFHGFRVSPSGLADNVLRTIAPAVTSRPVAAGHSAKIVVHIPKSHEHGLYWYHPHMHGLVDGQVYPGLAGIVVGNVLQDLPQLKNVEQRSMALQAVQLDGNQLVNVNKVSGPAAESNLVNGHYQPTLTIRPGELQLWRVANISNDFWYKLRLGGRKLYVIAEDGNPVGRVWADPTLLLPPGKRFEFLVRGPGHGTYALQTIPFDQGFAHFPRRTLVRLVSKGPAVSKGLRIPKVASPSQAKIQRATLHDPIYRRRVLTFSIKKPFPKNFQAFLINHKLFNLHRVDERVRLRTTEEWLLRNTSSEDHPFHIHTNDFLVEKVNGHKRNIYGFQDVVRIPREQHGRPGTVLIRIRYRTYTGKAVFHCHILFHEDNAMMGIIQFKKK
jgi:FtsP/CotA-like multicopper oxidase with cupredoxin domain